MKKKYLTKELNRILFIVLTAVILELLLYQYVSFNEERRMSAIIERNEMSSCMHIVVDRMKNAVNQDFPTIDWKVYQVNDEKLDHYIVALRDTSQQRNDFIEALEQLKQYQNQLNNLVEQGKQDEFNLICEKMKAIIEVMIVNDLQISKDEYDIEIASFQRQKNLLNAIVFLTVLGSIIYLSLAIKQIKQEIETVQDGAKNLISSNWKSEVQEAKYAELNELSVILNKTKDTINAQLNELEAKQKLEKRLHEEQLQNERKDRIILTEKLNNLKNQINPHFMFNALNIISRSIELKQGNASDLIEGFSSILRYSLESDRIVDIHKDLAVVEDYLKIQKLRFDERLDYTINNKVTNTTGIVPMLIQPMVENSIKHGIQLKQSLKISIQAFTTSDGMIDITIEDNGCGFNVKEVLENGNGVGLTNTIKRVELIYKNKGNMEIKSILNQGTTIHFILTPLTIGEEL